MKNNNYMISLKVNDEIIFRSEKKKKDIKEWIEAYNNQSSVEEIKIYQRSENGLSYNLIYSDNRRKVGF